jgi:SAM-dependent methyltransferase
MNPFQYIGSELEIFEKAHKWKKYFYRHIAPYIQGDVLEVGAGFGGTTEVFQPASFRRWVCLEPDHELCERARERLAGDPRYEVIAGTTRELPAGETFDAIVYIDVLEHIEDDSEEARRAMQLLKPGGALVVLSPAHQWLYTPFDASIGHFRRYTRVTLEQAVPTGARREKLVYLDSVGLIASLANRIWLRQSMPALKQILFWDNVLVPASRWIDPVLFHQVGKSVLGIWRNA